MSCKYFPYLCNFYCKILLLPDLFLLPAICYLLSLLSGLISVIVYAVILFYAHTLYSACNLFRSKLPSAYNQFLSKLLLLSSFSSSAFLGFPPLYTPVGGFLPSFLPPVVHICKNRYSVLCRHHFFLAYL